MADIDDASNAAKITILSLASMLTYMGQALKTQRCLLEVAEKDAKEWEERYWKEKNCPTCDEQVSKDDAYEDAYEDAASMDEYSIEDL